MSRSNQQGKLSVIQTKTEDLIYGNTITAATTVKKKDIEKPLDLQGVSDFTLLMWVQDNDCATFDIDVSIYCSGGATDDQGNLVPLETVTLTVPALTAATGFQAIDISGLFSNLDYADSYDFADFTIPHSADFKITLLVKKTLLG